MLMIIALVSVQVISISSPDKATIRQRYIDYHLDCSNKLQLRANELINMPVGQGQNCNKKDAIPEEWYRAAELIYAIGCGYGSSAVNQRLDQAVEYSDDCISMDWYSKYYGLPQNLGKALLKLKSYDMNAISSKSRDKVEQFLERNAGSSLYSKYGGHNVMSPTFAKLINGLYFDDDALLEKSAEIASRANKQIVTIDEGLSYGNIQKDWSFFEHGMMPNFHYGASGVRDFGYYLRITEGTSLSLVARSTPDDPQQRTAIELFGAWYTNFLRWLAFKGYTDPYPDTKKPRNCFSYLTRGLNAILETDYSELKPLHPEMKKLIDKNQNLVGAMAYPVANYLLVRRPNYFASVRMANVGKPAEEFSSFKSIFGNINFVTANHPEMMRTDAIKYYPSVLLKSVTFAENCEDKIHTPGKQEWGSYGCYIVKSGGWDFYGQSTLEGYYGIAAENLQGKSIKMRKSWFFLDDEIVALASGITSTDANDKRMLTWLDTFEEQVNSLSTSRGQKSIDFEGNLGILDWLHHDETGIVFPESLSVNAEKVDDNIADIPTNKRIPHRRYYLDHGIKPVDSKFAVIYLPAANSAATQSYAADPDIDIIKHDKTAHIVRETTQCLVGAAFFEPFNHQLIGSNLPVYVLYRSCDDRFSLSVHNPHLESLANFTIGWPPVSPKVDYDVPANKATYHAYQINIPYKLSKSSAGKGNDLFSLSADGKTLHVRLRPYRTFELTATRTNDGSYAISKARIGYNGMAEDVINPTTLHVQNCNSCFKNIQTNPLNNQSNNPPNKADVNKDGSVDISDLILVIRDISGKTHDINDDGVVDVHDLLVIINHL